MSAVEIAARIASGSLSAREAVESHLARIGAENSKYNAVVTLAAEQALEAADAADRQLAAGEPVGPLHGVPVLHKDLQPTKGIRTTFGSRLFQDFVPDTDSLLVERLKAAGAITLGKTNTPEFGAGSQTFNAVFGKTLNPWDTTKTCGGSTGGGAVALATGMTPLADGSDLGGSLRNPASFCGVVGLRPTAGRVPAWPIRFPWLPLSVEGPMARSVSDLALFCSAITGYDPRAPLSFEDNTDFAAPLGRDLRGTRVAWWTGLGGIPVDKRVRDITEAQRTVFESLGCIVEEAEPDLFGADEAFRTLRTWMTETALGDSVRAHPALFKDTIHWEIERAAQLTARDVGLAHLRLAEIQDRMRRFMERNDFFVLPVSQVPPFDVNLPFPMEVDGVRMETYIDWMKSCYLISVTGAPALSVPAGFTPEGLPVGIQIVGGHRKERALLEMGHAFEQAVGITRRLI